MADSLAAVSEFDTGITLNYVVKEYMTDHLDGVIDETYGKPQGRIIYRTKADPSMVTDRINDPPVK